MDRGVNSDSIPTDLILEILSRLPAKSIGRFRCVSKLWESMLSRPYFTELFLTRSSARPRLLIGIFQDDKWFFFSSPQPQPQNLHEKSSLVVAADFHMKFSTNTSCHACRYASGLLCYPRMLLSKEDRDDVRVICNPITGQYAILPEPRTRYRNSYNCRLGFDPIGRQFKVLLMSSVDNNDELVHHILTLGTEKVRWRKIQCPLPHDPYGDGICISGVLYYIAYYDGEYFISCFDVRSEKFKVLNRDCFRNWTTMLVNYKGKLGAISLEDDYDGGFPLKVSMWVLEDAEKREWSTYVYTLRAEDDIVVKADDYISIVGVTASGEIVLAKDSACKPFYVFYFNPERNTLLSVEIQGFGEDQKWLNYHTVCVFVDHVEDLEFNVDNMCCNIYKPPPEQKRRPTSTSTSSRNDHQERIGAHLQQDRRPTFETANKFNALCLLDDDELTG